jgi:putative hydrolase of the HAD superfamily
MSTSRASLTLAAITANAPTPASTCVVVDLDDTLFLERDYVQSGFEAVAAWLARSTGVEGFFAAAWELFESGARGTTFDLALVRCGIEPTSAMVRQLVARYRAHTPDIQMLPDARDFLDRLATASVRLAIVSDGPLESQRAKAAAMDAEAWADPVVLTAGLGPGFAKPSPEAFRTVEAATGCAGGTCTYLADNPVKDFTGPRSLGWRTVRVRRSGSLHERAPSGHDVDLEVADLVGLPERLFGAHVADLPAAPR